MIPPLPLALLFLVSTVVAQGEAPRVVSLVPENGNVEVDASGVRELVVAFDRPMRSSGWSFAGGGPTFPRIPEGQRPRWKDDRTCILPVDLDPDHSYVLSLNAPSATNFRSAEGVPLVPVPWSFSTLPDEPPDPRRQKALNKKAFEALKDILASRYSYYDLRGLDWERIFGERASRILAARTTRGWAVEVGRMLEPTEDLHLHLRVGEQVIPTGRRAVDSLYRSQVLKKHLGDIQPLCKLALAATTDDRIGYLMIAGWTQDLDLDALEQALAGMKDCKGLVIDIRPNSGGDELLAARIAKFFIPGTRTYAKNRYRTGKGKHGFGPVHDRTITGHGADRRLGLPVVLLTSRYVMSSCEAFVLMMRQAPNCTVVGQPTFGSSGNPKPHELPNGVTVVVPSWQALRPDGSCFEGEGLKPDVVVDVSPEALGEKDPILERALSLLREKR
jgi:hypothetical protein